MSEHTKEPWPFGATPISSKDEALALFKQSLDARHGDLVGFFYEIFTEDGKRIAFLVGPSASANARRIVACVNACAGIPTDDLELCPSGGLLHLAAHSNRLVEQRDELLAALIDAKVSTDLCLNVFEALRQQRNVWAEGMLESAELYAKDCIQFKIKPAIASVKGGA